MMQQIQPPVPNPISASDARAAIERERKSRIDACAAAVNAVLEQYRCSFDVSVTLRHGQVIPQMQVVSVD